MKRITKVFFSVSFLLLITIMTFSQYSKGLYSSELKNNSLYTWNVQTLEKVGTYTTPYLTIGDVGLKQGDVIKLRLTNDTDEVANGSVANLWGKETIYGLTFLLMMNL
ncbi:MAG: hypothetical protein K9W46_03740 [Candidatus Heimdallarchaeum endolithica]|uniref:Uncharacterized protein n=1 Tax=Candidatus Heimdallarchaeum endolithica TaxID=2876572 RepID=A0A9Y1BSS9_9ARCH|nr:MAG: hypothetical protein K9W46_03740 [Candidatus Heimdallarchaeum endolithica]